MFITSWIFPFRGCMLHAQLLDSQQIGHELTNPKEAGKTSAGTTLDAASETHPHKPGSQHRFAETLAHEDAENLRTVTVPYPCTPCKSSYHAQIVQVSAAIWWIHWWSLRCAATSCENLSAVWHARRQFWVNKPFLSPQHMSQNNYRFQATWEPLPPCLSKCLLEALPFSSELLGRREEGDIPSIKLLVVKFRPPLFAVSSSCCVM